MTQRRRWQRVHDNVVCGNIVLVLDASLVQRGRWPLGRVTAVHPGTDNRVRVATVQPNQGSYVRPITKLCLLPATGTSE